MQKSKFAALLALSVCFFWGADLHAATNYVVKMRSIGTRFLFDPTNIVIFTGDSIRWTNSDTLNTHDTTHNTNAVGGPRLWASVQLSNTLPNNTFSFRFATNGSYPYFCLKHTSLGFVQTGLVSVITPPLITSQSATVLPDGSFRFDVFGGSAGQRCVIEASDAQFNWVQIWTT